MTAFIRRFFSGTASTTSLASSMTSSDVSFIISSASGWPGSPGNDFFVVVDRNTSSEEVILCTQNSGTTVTVAARGQDGTTATGHNSGAVVEVCITAVDGDEANQVVNLLGNAAAGSLFYGAGAATLPSKLVVGSVGQSLGVSAGLPAWLTQWNTYLITVSPVGSPLSGDSVEIDATAGNVIVPALVGGTGARFRFQRKDATANTVTITAPSGKVIVGAGLGAGVGTTQLTTQGAYIELQIDPSGNARVVGLSAAASAAAVPLSETQYGPSTDPAYAISSTAMTAVDTTNLTTSSFTVPASGKIKVTVSGLVSGGTGNTAANLAMLNHSGGAQVGDTIIACWIVQAGVIGYPFTRTWLITGLSAGSLQLDLAMYGNGTAEILHALVSATPSRSDFGPITIIIEAA